MRKQQIYNHTTQQKHTQRGKGDYHQTKFKRRRYLYLWSYRIIGVPTMKATKQQTSIIYLTSGLI